MTDPRFSNIAIFFENTILIVYNVSFLIFFDSTGTHFLFQHADCFSE